MSTNNGSTKRGFASMDQAKQKEIASRGGKAAHAKGTAHQFDASEARAAGRKGGMSVSKNREHMSAIGRKGGLARRGLKVPASSEATNVTTTDAPVSTTPTTPTPAA